MATLSELVTQLEISGRWDRVDVGVAQGTPDKVLTFPLELRKYLDANGNATDKRLRIVHQIVRAEVTGRTATYTEDPNEDAKLIVDETLPPEDPQPWMVAVQFVIDNNPDVLGMLWANVGPHGGYAKMLVTGPKVEVWAIYREAGSWTLVPMVPQPAISPL